MVERSAIPFFLPTPERALTQEERAVLDRLIEDLPAEWKAQAPHLKVVGRCGCGKCPTIFFESHQPGDREFDLTSCDGRDEYGGIVSVVLLEKQGRLSQLEFFSVDGHDPWNIPKPHTLQCANDA